MISHRRPLRCRARVVVLAPALAAGLVGCGDAGDRSDGHESSVSRPVLADVVSIAAGADGRSLVARVDVLPVEGSTGACAVDVSHNVDFERDLIYLGITYETDEPGQDPAFPGCETGPRDVVVDLGARLDERHVITDASPATRWVPATGDSYVRCELPACDAATGTTPRPATCDDSTLADAVRSSDVPRHSGLSHRRCELPWAVVDVDVGAGGCPATGDQSNTCAGHDVRRTYWRVAGYTWEQVGASTGAGCGGIAAVVPDFPLDLCADLPPPP